jgi:glycosyltransferase involved in cell wall biosynthesis
MKVCLVGPAYPYRGGIAHFTTLLAREFSRNHEVLVVNFSRLYPSMFFPGKTQYDESGAPIDIPSERIVDSINPVTYVRAARRIARFSPDVVIFQWWHPFFAFAFAGINLLLKRLWKGPTLYLCHNVLPHEASVVDRTLSRIGFRGVDGFLVQSREDETRLQSLKGADLGGKRSAVHPHPIYDMFRTGTVDREAARRTLGVTGRVALFFGYIRPYKGVSILLEAFAEVLKRVEMTLLVVGEFYEDRKPYDELIARLGIGDHLVVVDRYVPNEEVETYFEAADVVVLPYRSATQSGIVQVAYGFDTPVIVTAVGGLPDVVTDGKTGFVVPPEDRAALAGAMITFFEENRSREMSAEVAAAKDRFSWQRCAEILLELSSSGGPSRAGKT